MSLSDYSWVAQTWEDEAVENFDVVVTVGGEECYGNLTPLTKVEAERTAEGWRKSKTVEKVEVRPFVTGQSALRPMPRL